VTGYPRADGDLAAFTRANYPDGGITLPAQTGDELVTPVGAYRLVRVAVERLHQIDSAALAREGFESVGSFVAFWDSYYGDRPWATWAANPWVVVYQWMY
jgi:hypothetical protein